MIRRLILLRFGTALITLLTVSILIFSAVEMIPGDIAARVLGRFATEETKQLFRKIRNLDRPAYERYWLWLQGVMRGNFGRSLVTDKNTSEVVAPKLRNSLILAGYSFLLYLPISIILPALAAVFRDEPVDIVLSILTLVGISIPEFVLGTILMMVFALAIPIFPVLSIINLAKTPLEVVRTITLPAVTLAIATAVYAIRMLRDNLIEVLDSTYIHMATLKGLRRIQVVFKHALPNAIIPMLNVTAINMAFLIGGVVLVERVFSFPGIGNLLVEAVFMRDAPVIEATALIISSIYIIANLIADVLTVLFNPRLRND